MVNPLLRAINYLLSVFLLCTLPISMAYAIHDKSLDAVKIGVEQLPTVFSPYADVPLDLQYVHLFFDPLLSWNKDNRFEKRLVSNWKPIKKGVTRFYLKKNITFHSGNVLTSEDVAWTFKQMLKKGHVRYSFEGIFRIKPVNKDSFDVYNNISEMQILDYFTHFYVLDSQFYEKNAISLDKPQGIVEVGDNRLSISGTGPYKIKQYNAALNLDVVANENYWQGQAGISELNFIKIKSVSSRTFALLGNDIDISEIIENDLLKTLRLDPSKEAVKVPSPNLLFLTINSKRSPVFEQPNVRKAINLAINKQGILQYLLDDNGHVSAVYSPSNEYNIKPPEYDVDQAKELLSDVDMPLEITLLVISDPSHENKKITDALVNMMKILGIKLVVTEVNDINEWQARMLDFDLTLNQWHSTLMESHNIYHHLFHDSVLSHYFSTVFKQGKVADNIEEQIAFFQNMQQSYQITPLVFQNKTWAADKQFNLSDIFSGNGIAYWYLLQKSHSH